MKDKEQEPLLKNAILEKLLGEKSSALEKMQRELEIESSLERVRAVAMSMNKPDDMLHVCRIISEQLELLKVKEIRNVQTAIFYEAKTVYINYEFYAKHDKTLITEVDYKTHSVQKTFADQMMKGPNEFFTQGFSGKQVQDWYAYQKTTNVFIDTYLEKADSLDYYWYSLGPVALGMSTYKPLSEEELNLFKRFKNVFELAYRRYLDIEKAEAQAREVLIELALERVRARTMAMQKSDELSETAYILFQQFKELGENPLQITIGIFNEQKKVIEFRITGLDGSGSKIDQAYDMDIEEPVLLHKIYAAWKEQRKSAVIELTGKDLRNWSDYKSKIGESAKPASDISDDERRFVSVGFFSKGMISFSKRERIAEETIKILERFATVFDQTYTRFLDLQKAEAQTREARIEVALERARTQSMLMQHSKELDDTLRVFHEQVLQLSIRSAFSFLWLPDEEKDQHIFWAAWAENNSTVFKSKAINYPLDRKEPATAQCLVDWKGNEPVVAYHVPPTSVKDYFAAWSELIAGVEELKPENFSDGLYYIEAFMKYGCFGVMVKNTLPEDEKKILNRFAVEFERAYTRFLDLQKAEAQAREAQIEAALEKVRSRSLAMHKSGEILEVVRAVFERLNELNIELNTAFIIIFKDGSRDTEWWLINKDKGEYSRIPVKYADLLLLKDMFETKEQGKELFLATYHSEEKNELFRYLFTQTDFKYAPPERQKFIFESEAISISMAMTNKIAIQITRHHERSFSEEDNEILKRFTKVFDQSYTRFLDLQKAEAQAREAQIELGLERVRAKAMAMHSTADLSEATNIFFKELKTLDVTPMRCGIGEVDEENQSSSLVYTTADKQGELFEILGTLKHQGHPVIENIFKHWKQQEEYHPVLEGAGINEYYRAIRSQVSLPEFPQYEKHYGNYFYFREGFLFTWAERELSEEGLRIARKFTSVLSLTYRRYKDLKEAEAQARESQIEAALERVRSKAMAMQKSEDLADAVAIVFEELDKLNMGTLRCGISIINKENRTTNIWSTTKTEKGTAVQVSGDESMDIHPLLQGAYSAWLRLEDFSYFLRGEDMHSFYTALAATNFKLPDVSGEAQAQQQYMYVAHFPAGGLYVFRETAFPEEAKIIIKRFADVFNLTYTRFNDLKQAEYLALQAQLDLENLKIEKRKTEEALRELKATQHQLIQSEKMASLGELTAGIAHEIQNPLNFVNNFSDVNTELIEELKTELQEGNTEEVIAIANDIKANEQKINHHGKRADAIVKGMLQHSRSSSGIKESADVNALTDEYLRLSYHGLRAKDKSFNATMKTEFDESIGNINVIPQDIGRVLLNLYNNAFYAVNEKKKQQPDGYDPIVSVSTKKVGDKLFISVKDNGNGIPQKVQDKIFQPFFTTKPTGQGTGLGLSLSYDIVKAHGGEIRVESKEGEGSEFIIQLPV